MKAVRLHAYGDVDQFKVEEVPTPTAGPGEVLIKVAVSGLNHVELFARQGYLQQYYPLQLPAILGNDAAGTISAVGSGVSAFKAGDRVVARVGVTGKGTHADYVVAPVAGIAKLPANVSFEAGATLPLVGLTGRQVVDALAVKKGDRVLVSGALGGVGRVAVQYLKELGAIPVAGVLRDRLDDARRIVGEAIDLSTPPAKATFDLAITTAAPAAANTVKHVRDGGRVVAPVPAPEGANPAVAFQTIASTDDPVMLQKVVDAAARGELVIPITKTFPLEQLGEAHRALAAGAAGKVVLVR